VTAAFEYAKKRGFKGVTICEKPNVVRETSGMMEEVAKEVAKNYPGLRFGRRTLTRN
jgi:isocitrate dehydrogenase (NAD+)